MCKQRPYSCPSAVPGQGNQDWTGPKITQPPNKLKDLILSSILFYLLQLGLFYFAVLILQNRVMGKPFESQDPDEIFQRYSEEELEPSHAVNETLGARNKRQVPVSLKTACPGMYQCDSISRTPNSNPCVKGWYYCPKYNVYEAVCKLLYFSCPKSIVTIGTAKCQPVKKSINSGNKILTITKNCRCA